MHPTVKPVAMIADAMRDCSRRGSIVLDGFAGSGTTIIVAEQIGRCAHCLEIDPHYADVAIRRWQAFTKRDAVLEGSGATFDELAELRARTDRTESVNPTKQHFTSRTSSTRRSRKFVVRKKRKSHTETRSIQTQSNRMASS